MYLDDYKIDNHPILKDLSFNFINPNTGEPYSIVAFVGENGCGKTTLLNEISKLSDRNCIFIRQNSMYYGLANETYKLICGETLYPITTNNSKEEKANLNKEASLELLKCLNDDALLEIYESGKLDKSRCGGEATRIIDGRKDYFDLNTLSSGQQEILLKLKMLTEAQIKTDIVLLDEPETSLHPRWQKRIIGLIREITKDKDGNIPQLFIATHSEKVLESLIHREDTLIIGLTKNDNQISAKPISGLDLVLPRITFAELDYVIFKIDSFEYCSELYDLLEWRTGKHISTKIDKLITSCELFDGSIHTKQWVNDLNGDVTNSLPVYCRNYFHHPKDREEPTEKQLHDAIELLRNILLNMK